MSLNHATTGNAFDQLFSQNKENQPTVDNSTPKTVKSKRTLKDGKQTKAKTFFLELEIIEMFKYVKFKQKIDESKYANMVLDEIFTKQFGKNWRKLVK